MAALGAGSTLRSLPDHTRIAVVSCSGRPRSAFGMSNPDHVYAQGAVVPGNSGSAIISSDGRAAGVIVTIGIHPGSIGTGGVDAGLMGITRITPQVNRAEQVLGTDLTL